MNHYRVFILSRQYGHSPEKNPPRPDPHRLAERIVAGEEIDRDTIWEHLKDFKQQWFRDVLKIVVSRTEVVPPGIIHCLIEASPTWLSEPIVQRQIQVWQMKAMGDHKNRTPFKKALRGIGTALDPTTGKGNPQALGGTILLVYEKRYKAWHEAIRLIKRDFKNHRDLRDPDVVSTLADSSEYKEKLGEMCATQEERIQLIKDVVHRRPAASCQARRDIVGVMELSEGTIKKIIERERRKLSMGGTKKSTKK